MKPTPETIAKYETFVKKMKEDIEKHNEECHRKVLYLQNQIEQCYNIRDTANKKKGERLVKYEAILTTLLSMKASQAV